MDRKPHSSLRPKKRRTTLTLPADSLTEAQRIAQLRKVSLGTVIAEAFVEGLRRQTAAERRKEVLEGYKKAFSGFSDEELSILDGVMLEPAARRQPMVDPAVGPFLFDTSAARCLSFITMRSILKPFGAA
jgi:hypothetical protein